MCYVNIGAECTNGVHVKVDDLNWVEYDHVYFTYKKDGVEYQTEKMSGCLEGSPSHTEDDCVYTYEYTSHPMYHYDYTNHYMADITGEYNLQGTDTKAFFYSDYAQSGGKIKFSWKCLPAGSDDNDSDDSDDSEDDSDARDPYERLLALEAKALEVVELGGWDNDSAFYKRVSNKLAQIITKADEKRLALDEKCDFPAHWDWKEYLVCKRLFEMLYFKNNLQASQNEQRYNQDDPCLATQQIFLGFDRRLQIYTKNCKKTGDAQLKFHSQKVKQLNKLRNKMFVDMQCASYVEKYDL